MWRNLFQSTERAFTVKMRPCLSESDSPNVLDHDDPVPVTVAGVEIEGRIGAVEASLLRVACKAVVCS